MKKVYTIRQIVVALTALAFLSWAFFQNGWLARIVITLFLICSFSIMMQKIFLLLNKTKLSNIFKYIFRISFFVYVIGFLLYMIYYAIVNKSYSILIVVAVFLLFTIHFFKKSFFHKEDKH